LASHSSFEICLISIPRIYDRSVEKWGHAERFSLGKVFHESLDESPAKPFVLPVYAEKLAQVDLETPPKPLKKLRWADKQIRSSLRRNADQFFDTDTMEVEEDEEEEEPVEESENADVDLEGSENDKTTSDSGSDSGSGEEHFEDY
jgi:hypothetical protein